MEQIPTGGADVNAPPPDLPGPAGVPQSAPSADDTVTVISGGRRLTGWQAVRITRGCERMPSDFDVALTERYPGEAAEAVISPGSPCQVMCGNALVITGYIDRYTPSISPRNHRVRIMGRSKSEDVTDCSVTPTMITGMQIITSSLLDLATQLCKPFGITVTSLTGDNIPLSQPGGAPLQFNAVLTETCFEIIERVARYAGVLVYDDTDGNLIIAKVGATQMASGFAQGVNVQAAAASFSMDERFSVYLPMLMSTNFLGQQGIGGAQFPEVKDQGVPRFRPLIVVSEQFQFGESYAEKRAQWEMARRFGRSQAVRLTCDSWRDSAGNLWTPNSLVTIDLPALKLTPSEPWVIGDVTLIRDQERGTVADLTIMPKEAFTPEPSILQQFLWDPTTVPPTGGGGAAVPGGAPT